MLLLESLNNCYGLSFEFNIYKNILKYVYFLQKVCKYTNIFKNIGAPRHKKRQRTTLRTSNDLKSEIKILSTALQVQILINQKLIEAPWSKKMV
jgi:hypothetical protein